MKDKKTIRNKQITQTIDSETGELIELEVVKNMVVDKEPDYVKLYIKDLIRLNDLPSATGKVLNCLLQNMGYKNIIPVYSPIKKLICKNLNISLNTLNKAIDQLYKKDILVRIDRGLYLADPELFGRGKWEDIKDIRMMITYDSKGKKTIQSSLNRQLGFDFPSNLVDE